MARSYHHHRRLSVIALGLLLCALPDYAHAQNTEARIVPGPEILVSRGEDFAHVETMLAANPINPRHLLASSIILPKDKNGAFLFRTRAYVSRDAGRTWKASPLPNENLWDPVIAFTPRGTALLVCLLPPKSLLVFRSADGGITWKDRIELAFTDRPMMAVDWTGNDRRGRIYIAGRLGEERTDPIVVHRSDDDGRTFAMSVAVKEPIVGWALNPIVLQDGTLFLPFRTQAEKRLEQIDGVRSSDGGRAFSQPFRIATRPENGQDASDTPPAVFAAGMYRGRERLFGVYTTYRGDANARLVLSRSEDGGRSWTEGKQVVGVVAAELTHGAANLSVNAAGVVGISWLQRKIGDAPRQGDKECEKLVCFNEIYDLYFTASLDGGDTFLEPVRISSQSSNPRPKHASRFWPGQDYMLTTASTDGTFHLLWPDARSGVFQLYARAVRVE